MCKLGTDDENPMVDRGCRMGKARGDLILCGGDCSADAEGVLSLYRGMGRFPGHKGVARS